MFRIRISLGQWAGSDVSAVYLLSIGLSCCYSLLAHDDFSIMDILPTIEVLLPVPLFHYRLS
jgi:hypothetical protein